MKTKLSTVSLSDSRAALARALCLVLLGLTSAAAVAQPAPEKRAKGQATFRGAVLYADTDEPVRRARVALVRLEALVGDPLAAEALRDDLQRLTATNARGEFVFTKLAAGKYAIAVSAPGIVWPGGSAGASLRLDPLGDPELYAEQVIETDGVRGVEKTIRAPRGGAVAGRVTYSDGEPATNVSVGLFSRVKGEWTRYGTPVLADDRGRYRVESLPEGEYVVGASEANVFRGEGRQREPVIFFATFHPAATTAAKATPVRVDAGREAGDIDLTISDDLRRVSGLVKWRRDGRPAANASVRIAPAGRPAPGEQPFYIFPGGGPVRIMPQVVTPHQTGSTLTQTADEDGRWSLENLPDGDYVVTVSATYSKRGGRGNKEGALSPLEAPERFVQKSRDLTVAGGDVTGFDVELAEGGRISGQVVYEGTASPPAGFAFIIARPSALSHAYPPPSTTRPDGTFDIDGLTDSEVHLDAYLQGMERFYVKSVTGPDGADLLRNPVRVGEGTSLEGVRIVIAGDGASVAGRLRMADGSSAMGASVYLVPADPALWGARVRQKRTMTGVEGRFQIDAAPGDYLLFAADSESSLADVSELVTTHAASAVRLTLHPNERREVELAPPAAR
jgi:hypothetical protein